MFLTENLNNDIGIYDISHMPRRQYSLIPSPQATRRNMFSSEKDACFETLAARTYRELRHQIIAGRRQPGNRLVRRVLSRELGVSPVPVTEALFKLEQDGLVETVPMYGSRVIRLTRDRIRNDQILREAIECQAIRLCAEHAKKSDLQDLEHLAIPLDEAMLQTDPHNRAGMQQHMDFHLAVARVSGCTSLEDQLIKLWNCRMMQLNWINAALNKVPKQWHQRLVRKMTTRDPDAAEAAMRKHVRHGTDSLLQAHQEMISLEEKTQSSPPSIQE